MLRLVFRKALLLHEDVDVINLIQALSSKCVSHYRQPSSDRQVYIELPLPYAVEEEEDAQTQTQAQKAEIQVEDRVWMKSISQISDRQKALSAASKMNTLRSQTQWKRQLGSDGIVKPSNQLMMSSSFAPYAPMLLAHEKYYSAA